MKLIKDEIYAIIIAIICLTLIEVIALYYGIDGSLLSLVVGAITTLMGYVYGKKGKEEGAKA